MPSTCNAQSERRSRADQCGLVESTYTGCGRTAKVRIGELNLCTAHAKLARDGLMDTEGCVAPAPD